MKGYLQRMAENAAQPRAGLHPRVGSIYADPGAADLDSGAAGGWREVAPEAASEEEHPFQNWTQPKRAESELYGATEFESKGRERPSGEHENARRVKPAVFQPLLDEATAEPAAGRLRGSAVGAQPDVLSEEFDRGGRGSPSEPASNTAQRVLRETSLPSHVINAVTKAKPDPFTRSAQAEREPDKVEIHIGRIEVTAVSQETPRPAAPRTRKSLDLGEYLKRRDGRIG
jgi:hypothetical protein